MRAKQHSRLNADMVGSNNTRHRQSYRIYMRDKYSKDKIFSIFDFFIF
jgi:hypothetical protein